MNTRYQSGRRLEWELCKLFRKHGWSASRTAGSHGEYDVLAVADVPADYEGWEIFNRDGWELELDAPNAKWSARLTKVRGGKTLTLWTACGRLNTGREIVLIQAKIRSKRKPKTRGA
jgi:Holliday junction resolvase